MSVKDLHSGMIAVYPVTEKDATSTIEALHHFAGRKKIHNSYSDNALELAASARSLGIEHHTSLPGEPKTNSIIERTNQIIVGGTTASLIAAGLPPCYWSYATRCFCTNFNAQGLLDASPWEKVHGTPFPTTIIPFGALGFFKPPNTGAHAGGKWEGNARKGVFAGYQMRSVADWSKQYLVWELTTFKNTDLRTSATFRHQRI